MIAVMMVAGVALVVPVRRNSSRARNMTTLRFYARFQGFIELFAPGG